MFAENPQYPEFIKLEFIQDKCIELDGRKVILGTTHDITERKWTEELLREERNFISAILHTVATLVVVLDPQGRIVRFNRACEQTTGYSFGEVEGKCFWDLLLVPEEVGPVQAVFQELQTVALPSQYENYWVTKDGNRRLIAWSNTVLQNSDGSVEYVIGTGVDITERQRAEAELHENAVALGRNQEALRALTAQLIHAQEEERKRIARELHDDLNQKLAVLGMELGKLEQPLRFPDQLPERLRSLQDSLGNLSDDVRNMAYRLHPATLEYLGLEAALRSECAQFSEREGLEVEFTSRNLPDSFSEDVSLCLYRVAQESLWNIAKHAAAGKVRVTLAGEENGSRFCVEDTGGGFDPEQAKDNGGLGLVSMEERVRLVKGSLTVQSKPGHGTRVEVWVPPVRDKS